MQAADWQWLRQLQDGGAQPRGASSRRSAATTPDRSSCSSPSPPACSGCCCPASSSGAPIFSLYFSIGVIRLASVVHAVCALVLICAILLHIYAAIWVKGSLPRHAPGHRDTGLGVEASPGLVPPDHSCGASSNPVRLKPCRGSDSPAAVARPDQAVRGTRPASAAAGRARRAGAGDRRLPAFDGGSCRSSTGRTRDFRGTAYPTATQLARAYTHGMPPIHAGGWPREREWRELVAQMCAAVAAAREVPPSAQEAWRTPARSAPAAAGSSGR